MKGSKDILQETSRYQEILNTVVGSKVYYMFQEEVYKALKDPNDVQLGNKIALDEAVQYLWWEYVGEDGNTIYLKRELDESEIWYNVFDRFIKEGIKRPSFITAETFEEFLEELKEHKFEKN